MLGTGTIDSSEELAVLVRNDFVESRHAGSVVVVSPDGDVMFSRGNPDALIFPRSAMKLFQAAALMSTGIELSGTHAAIATASHSGSHAHIELVREVLERGGFTDGDLGCASDWPVDKAMLKQVYANNGSSAPIFHCCSGKHAAMLLACVENDWPTSTYLEPNHPLQLRIREVVEYLTETTIPASAVDGCGAPVHAMPLVGLARGVSRLITAEEDAPFGIGVNKNNLLSAMLENPWVVGAHGEPDTLIMEDLKFYAKAGFEGVFIVATPEGVVAATKILDGNLRVAPAVALQALVRAGALEQEQCDRLVSRCAMDVTGGGQVVGQLQTSF